MTAPPEAPTGVTDQGFDAFYEVVTPSLVAVARALTGDRAIAEELAQEAMLVVLRGGSGDGGGRLLRHRE